MTAPGDAAFRCATASRTLEEPLDGTASTVGAFLLLESPAGWGVDAVRDARLPAAVKERLRRLEAEGVRPLLVRRPGRPAGTGVRVFAASARGATPWVRTATLGRPEELLALALDGLGRGVVPGLAPHSGPLFLVCTHGRHDACCAERGRPLAAALAAVAPEETWEVSHVGGDRFAGNVVVVPHGLYYGRLEPEDAGPFAAAHLAGRLDLDHLRGRSTLPFPAQVAEIHLRRELGETGIAAVSVAEVRREGSETRTVLVHDGVRWEVRVRSDAGPRRPLTCRAEAGSAPPRHRVTGTRRL